MPPLENDGEDKVQTWSPAEEAQKTRWDLEKIKVLKATDEYQLACRAAVQANKLEFDLKFSMSGGFFGDDEDSDDGTSFTGCKVSATLQCDGDDMPHDTVATLDFVAIAESEVNPATFAEDIYCARANTDLLDDNLLGSDGKFRLDLWGPGAPYEGTGVWGSELGRDLLVYIEHIEVDHFLRGMGIGTKLVNQALDWANEKVRKLGKPSGTCSYFVTIPHGLWDDVVREFGERDFYTRSYGSEEADVDAQDYEDELSEMARKFWRKQGFRRVGLSKFCAYANHPSRQLSAEDDWCYIVDPPPSEL